MYKDDFLDKKLNERKQLNALRTLKQTVGLIDFCSNDYLGIVHHRLIKTEAQHSTAGSTGSRLLTGNYALIEEVEKEIAAFHEADAALIFNSGYDANVGLLSSVLQRGDTVLYDYLSHASIRDGIRLSFAQAFSFEHNNLIDLEKKLKQATGNIFIVTETVFSMDGDQCPLPEIVQLAQQYHAQVIVDEAHATGVIGAKGEGLIQDLQLTKAVFARVHTFGKACGCHGAVILGSQKLRNYLINFARSFMYSTSLPPHAIEAIRQSYKIFPGMKEERIHLHTLIQYFQQAAMPYEKLISHTPIQVLIIPGNEIVKAVSNKLQSKGFDVRPILYPTVPKGKERLRIVLHAFNTKAQVTELIQLLQTQRSE